jgi:hypothetical protein
MHLKERKQDFGEEIETKARVTSAQISRREHEEHHDSATCCILSSIIRNERKTQGREFLVHFVSS